MGNDGPPADPPEAPADGSTAQVRAQDRGTGERTATDLEAAREDLRLAGERARGQDEEIARLVRLRERLEWQHQRTLELLPVPVVVTDRRGTVQIVNAAAAHRAAMLVAHVVGQPIAALVAREDRRRLQEVLEQADAPDGVRGLVPMTLISRDGAQHLVEAHVTRTAGTGEVVWVLLDPPPGDVVGDHADGRGLLPQALVTLAALGTRESGLQDLLQRAAAVCGPAVGTASELSLSVGPPIEPLAVAWSGPDAQGLDGAQLRAGEGPTHEAYATRRTVVRDGRRREVRWPRLARDEMCPQRSVVAVPLLTGDDVLGVLSVYRRGDPEVVVLLAELLGGALAALLHERSVRTDLQALVQDMERALSSRATIDQAKGIVMGELGCSPQAAFDHLVRLSSERGVKLRDLAQQLVESRTTARPGQPRSVER